MEASRRDFVSIAIGGMGVAGTLGVLYPIVKTLAPSAASTTEAKAEIDINQVPELGIRVTSFKGKPLFVVKLPQGASQKFSYKLNEGAKNSAGKHNQEVLGDKNVFALIGVCTHLGCIPLWKPQGADVSGGNPTFHCPCHGGFYTPWGDVIAGPPPRPLWIPPQRIEGNKLIVGEAGFVEQLT